MLSLSLDVINLNRLTGLNRQAWHLYHLWGAETLIICSFRSLSNGQSQRENIYRMCLSWHWNHSSTLENIYIFQRSKLQCMTEMEVRWEEDSG